MENGGFFIMSKNTFEGFTAPTSHTQTPNEFYDEILLSKRITIAEVKIIGFMIRHTFGWNRHGNSLKFTYSEIQKATSLGREAVNNALKKCFEKNYIQRKEINGKFAYRLNIKDFADYPWELTFEWQKVNKKLKESNADEEEKKEQFENRTNCSSKIEPI
ncbi:hypothetical protein MC28_B39 (plasmid) [Bacillus thuringiensis MC28]|nr:hypothetical protein MC28_B39 [Bacillus thuringiensis MC28]